MFLVDLCVSVCILPPCWLLTYGHTLYIDPAGRPDPVGQFLKTIARFMGQNPASWPTGPIWCSPALIQDVTSEQLEYTHEFSDVRRS